MKIPLMYNISLPDGFSRKALDVIFEARGVAFIPKVHWTSNPSCLGEYEINKKFEDWVNSLDDPPNFSPGRIVFFDIIGTDGVVTISGYVVSNRVGFHP